MKTFHLTLPERVFLADIAATQREGRHSILPKTAMRELLQRYGFIETAALPTRLRFGGRRWFWVVTPIGMDALNTA